MLADQLSSLSLFADVGAAELASVAHIVDERRFADGERVIRQGVTGSAFYVILAGEALLLVEGAERPLRLWDFVHCPAETKHIIIGAGAGPCVVLAVGAREHQFGDTWGGYTVDELALRHGAGVEQETTDAAHAYARAPARQPTGYREGWL